MKKHVSFGYMNAQMVRLHKAILSEKLDKIGITYGQVGFIMQALRNPGRTQDEMSTILSVDKGATARTIVKLEKKGFLYRKENPDNRRQKLVYPTEKAIEMRESLHEELRCANETMLADLDDNEKQMMMKLMTRVIDTCRDNLGMPKVWNLL